MTAPTGPGRTGSREKLLRCAEEQLAATGTVDVAAVAREAGLSVGLPYRYFGTRNGLLIAVLHGFYERLGQAAALRDYPAASWAEREHQRIQDWVAFLYDEPLAPIVLGGLGGDPEVAGANAQQLHTLIDLGARNMARAQQSGEITADRDPELLAAAVLGGTNAATALALTRDPRPEVAELVGQLWSFVAGAALSTPVPSPDE